jgi:hypothetical protein
MQMLYCDAQTFSTLYNTNSTSHAYYNGKGNLNAQYLVRILREKPNTWPDDADMRTCILNIALGTLSNGTPAADASSAITMIQTYCLITNPQWPTNVNMRTFINSLFTNQAGNNKTNANLQAMASTVGGTGTGGYCANATNQTKDACGCYNAVRLQYDGCKTQSGTKGCAEFAHLNTAFRAAAPQFAPIIAHMETAQFLKPQCISQACATANQNPSGDVLRTADTASFTCIDTEVICLQSLSVGGSVAPGATINQNCSTSFNVAGGTVIQATNNNGQLTGTATTVGAPGSGPAGTPIVTSTAPPGEIMVQGKAYKLSDFLVKPGKNKFVDKTLPTPNAQKGALGGCIAIVFICFCLILLLAVSGGDEGPSGPSNANILAAQSRGSAMTAGS